MIIFFLNFLNIKRLPAELSHVQFPFIIKKFITIKCE